MRSTRDEAFTAYVVARRGQLFRTAYLLCGDPHRAEDLVQTALAKLYAAWPRMARADSVDAYARRTVVNSHLDEGRRPWRRERPTDDAALDRAADQGLSVEDSDALWTALRALAPGQRRVVVLRHYWGLSVEETATDLGISTGTVKSQTSEALRHLRSALAPAGRDDTTTDTRTTKGIQR
ncbi:SigE family RNA polymerase sigma factor [Nocardioides ferulae]|uniref:SigE family RNA polymerase sigma factor n=1 Tax=Nocardioides ferulae TaxID=2340821 RepID=UPI000EB1908E|nr:SigE family RNA polymerase sigma factor [Nocardioides ferulae]